jgi:hypothetical protein
MEDLILNFKEFVERAHRKTSNMFVRRIKNGGNLKPLIDELDEINKVNEAVAFIQKWHNKRKNR